jgi:predicted dehydrogenase
MITVAILGGGFMAAAHAPGYRALAGRVRVKTVCSRSPGRAEKVASELGAAFTTDVEAVIRDPEVDALDIVVPTPLHRELGVRALDGGKDVLLEKPIALTLEDADAIIAAAERSGRQLMVGMVLRYFAEYVEIERRIRGGELGRPRSISAYRLSPPADWNEWMRDPAQSGGTAVDLMIHDFDQLNWLLGAPGTVFARSAAGAVGDVVACVEYDGGVGVVEGSMVMPPSYPFSAGIRVLCERGAIEHGFRAAPAEDGGNIGGDIESVVRLHPDEGPPQTLEVEGGDPWAAEVAEFVACLEEGRPVERGTGEQARAALRVALAVNRSLESGQPEAVG